MTHSKILPVYSHASFEQNLKILTAVYHSGLQHFEFTNRNENALEVFSSLVKHAKTYFPELKLGAGTIMNPIQAEAFTKEGASFLVSPLISKEMIDFTQSNNIDWIPGCGTGAEVGLAQNAGLTFVKLFPIQTLGGPTFVRLMKGPFFKMHFQVSGGIKGELEEVKSYLAAGADVIGLGNSFFSEKLSEEEITQKITALLNHL